jgi:hypothetical protein|tara:strand:- start:183 stop:407 length:225 start_codon:yes stop_codon:yes gene_type:complete
MAEQKRYKILERVTSGWHLIDARAYDLTKENCDTMLDNFVASGQNPNDIKAVLVDDPRYPTKKPDVGYVPPADL